MCECVDHPFGGCFETGKDMTGDLGHEVPDRSPYVRDGIAHVTEKTFDPGLDIISSILNRWKLIGGHKSMGRVTKVLVRSDRRSHPGSLHTVGVSAE